MLLVMPINDKQGGKGSNDHTNQLVDYLLQTYLPCQTLLFYMLRKVISELMRGPQ